MPVGEMTDREYLGDSMSSMDSGLESVCVYSRSILFNTILNVFIFASCTTQGCDFNPVVGTPVRRVRKTADRIGVN